MKEINGDLIRLAINGSFDIIVHGCNCFCSMGSGIAREIKDNFITAYIADLDTLKGDINKLGTYTYGVKKLIGGKSLFIINAYTQYKYGRDKKHIDYDALKLILRKINHNYKGKSIGLPQIGAGLAGGDWNIIKEIIRSELKDMDVTIIYYK